MAFDRSRPIPWKYLLRLLGIYLVVANIAFLALAKGQYSVLTFLSTVVGGGIYLLFSIVLTKFGWDPSLQKQRQLAAAQARREARAARSADAPRARRRGRNDAPAAKPKVSPTSRTNAGNPQNRTKAKR
jgi:hypothetical protein